MNRNLLLLTTVLVSAATSISLLSASYTEGSTNISAETNNQVTRIPENEVVPLPSPKATEDKKPDVLTLAPSLPKIEEVVSSPIIPKADIKPAPLPPPSTLTAPSADTSPPLPKISDGDSAAVKDIVASSEMNKTDDKSGILSAPSVTDKTNEVAEPTSQDSSLKKDSQMPDELIVQFLDEAYVFPEVPEPSVKVEEKRILPTRSEIAHFLSDMGDVVLEEKKEERLAVAATGLTVSFEQSSEITPQIPVKPKSIMYFGNNDKTDIGLFDDETNTFVSSPDDDVKPRIDSVRSFPYFGNEFRVVQHEGWCIPLLKLNTDSNAWIWNPISVNPEDDEPAVIDSVVYDRLYETEMISTLKKGQNLKAWVVCVDGRIAAKVPALSPYLMNSISGISLGPASEIKGVQSDNNM